MNIYKTGIFKRDLRKAERQGRKLEEKYRDHTLSGNWKHHRERHIRPDWLLIYRIYGDNLYLERTGSHSDLFN